MDGERRHRKRADGEGTIYQRPDGLYVASLMVGYRPDGKPDRRKVSAKTQDACRKKLDALKLQRDKAMLPARKTAGQTVADYCARWLASVQPGLAGRTWRRYGDVLRLHILPDVARKKLTDLRPEDLGRCYRQMAQLGRSPLTIRYLHAVVHRALADAVRAGDVPRNVADFVTQPKNPHQELHPPTAVELRRLLAMAEEAADPLAALWTLAVYSGCRQGELLALTWNDVDFDAGTMQVRRNLLDIDDGAPVIGDPKRRSVRTVTLPAEALAALRVHRQRQLEHRVLLGPDYASGDWVFASATGTPLWRGNVRRAWQTALKRAGLPLDTHFHALRHAAATLLLAAGVHPKVVADRLGHADVRMTLNVYSHAVPGLDQDAAERLAKVLGARSAAASG